MAREDTMLQFFRRLVFGDGYRSQDETAATIVCLRFGVDLVECTFDTVGRHRSLYLGQRYADGSSYTKRITFSVSIIQLDRVGKVHGRDHSPILLVANSCEVG